MRLTLLLLLYMVSSATFSGSAEKFRLERLRDGLILYYKDYTFQVQVCSPRIFHIVCTPEEQIPGSKSLVVNKVWESTSWNVEQKGQTLILKTSDITVEIDAAKLLCRFVNNSGELILEEKERAFSPVIMAGRSGWNAFETFKLTADEGIYGLGQHQDGWMNHRGKEVTLVQTNTTAVNPFLVSTRGWGILWDNYSKTYFRDDKNGATFWSEFGDVIDYYIFFGKDLDEVIAGYRQATGVSPLLSKWAYGFWQSKERYESAKELTDVVAEYRMRRLPLDVIVQDWKYWGEDNQWSSMEFDPGIYPEPEKSLERLHNLFHVHYVLSIWPVLGRDTRVLKELYEKGLTFSAMHWTGGFLYDAYNQEARDIYWNYVSSGLMSKGIDGLWMDGTEPEVADQHTFEESEANIKKLGTTAVGPVYRYLNTYSLVATRGIFEKWRADFPERRVLILTRSAFAGQQRNAAITWSGDINASYEVLRRQISAGLNFCASGIPYWTSDIGGFFVEGNDHGHGPGLYPGGCTDPAYKELYVRWFQFGAFCPVFRSHGTQTPREIWHFGDIGDWGYDALARFLNLRYRLLPYIYSVAWKVTQEGYTMMRGLPMDFPEDKKVYTLSNEYMFGPAILVCPVTQEQYFPLDTMLLEPRSLDNPASVSIYLPKGSDWIDFWTGETGAGGESISRETPIDILPLYIKQGSILPMGPFLQYADEKPADPIELRIYPGADGSFTLFEDKGDSYDYEQGKYTTILFSWDQESGTLTIGKRKGSFLDMLQNRVFRVVLVTPGHGVGVEQTSRPDKVITYNGDEIRVEFEGQE